MRMLLPPPYDCAMPPARTFCGTAANRILINEETVMHPNTSELFAETVEKTDAWLRELMQSMGYSQSHQAYSLLRAVLHVLRDRLTVEGAAKLGAQLPVLMRGFYYEGWHPAGVPLKLRHKQEFLAQVVKTCP